MTHSPTPTLPQTTRIIWIAFMAASLFYVIVAWIISSKHEPGPWNMPVTAALALMAVAAVVVGYFIPDRSMNKQIAEGSRLVSASGIYQTAMIVRWAGFESVAVIGLVLSIVNQQFLPALVCSLFAMVLIAVSPPRQEDLAKIHERLERGRS